MRPMRKQFHGSTTVGNRGRQLDNQTIEGTDHHARDNELDLRGAGKGASEGSYIRSIGCS